MELTSQVLRQVEFAPERLPGRGYRTSEVDDFLESVAVSVDELRQEMAELKERLERTSQSGTELSRSQRTDSDDEESIRRTLVLAQRTADLAVKEAQAEAAQLLDGARRDAESIVAEARQHAELIGEDADRHLKEEVTRLTAERDRLRGEIDGLACLLTSERVRLGDSLSTIAQAVGQGLSLSRELVALSSPGGGGVGPASRGAGDGSAAGSTTAHRPEIAASGGDPDVDELEAAIAADAAAAAPSPIQRRPSEGVESEGAARPSLMAVPPIGSEPHDGTHTDSEPSGDWNFRSADTPAS